jgi:STE24 endopeptidase
MIEAPLLLLAVAAALSVTGLGLWLSARQIAHVTRHRDRVPEDFAAAVTLEQHRKAADYAVARECLAMLETATGTAVSIAVLAWGAAAVRNFGSPMRSGRALKAVAGTKR